MHIPNLVKLGAIASALPICAASSSYGTGPLGDGSLFLNPGALQYTVESIDPSGSETGTCMEASDVDEVVSAVYAGNTEIGMTRFIPYDSNQVPRGTLNVLKGHTGTSGRMRKKEAAALGHVRNHTYWPLVQLAPLDIFDASETGNGYDPDAHDPATTTTYVPYHHANSAEANLVNYNSGPFLTALTGDSGAWGLDEQKPRPQNIWRIERMGAMDPAGADVGTRTYEATSGTIDVDSGQSHYNFDHTKPFCEQSCCTIYGADDCGGTSCLNEFGNQMEGLDMCDADGHSYAGEHDVYIGSEDNSLTQCKPKRYVTQAMIDETKNAFDFTDEGEKDFTKYRDLQHFQREYEVLPKFCVERPAEDSAFTYDNYATLLANLYDQSSDDRVIRDGTAAFHGLTAGPGSTIAAFPSEFGLAVCTDEHYPTSKIKVNVDAASVTSGGSYNSDLFGSFFTVGGGSLGVDATLRFSVFDTTDNPYAVANCTATLDGSVYSSSTSDGETHFGGLKNDDVDCTVVWDTVTTDDGDTNYVKSMSYANTDSTITYTFADNVFTSATYAGGMVTATGTVYGYAFLDDIGSIDGENWYSEYTLRKDGSTTAQGYSGITAAVSCASAVTQMSAGWPLMEKSVYKNVKATECEYQNATLYTSNPDQLGYCVTYASNAPINAWQDYDTSDTYKFSQYTWGDTGERAAPKFANAKDGYAQGANGRWLTSASGFSSAGADILEDNYHTRHIAFAMYEQWMEDPTSSAVFGRQPEVVREKVDARKFMMNMYFDHNNLALAPTDGTQGEDVAGMDTLGISMLPHIESLKAYASGTTAANSKYLQMVQVKGQLRVKMAEMHPASVRVDMVQLRRANPSGGTDLCNLLEADPQVGAAFGSTEYTKFLPDYSSGSLSEYAHVDLDFTMFEEDGKDALNAIDDDDSTVGCDLGESTEYTMSIVLSIVTPLCTEEFFDGDDDDAAVAVYTRGRCGTGADAETIGWTDWMYDGDVVTTDDTIKPMYVLDVDTGKVQTGAADLLAEGGTEYHSSICDADPAGTCAGHPPAYMETSYSIDLKGVTFSQAVDEVVMAQQSFTWNSMDIESSARTLKYAYTNLVDIDEYNNTKLEAFEADGTIVDLRLHKDDGSETAFHAMHTYDGSSVAGMAYNWASQFSVGHCATSGSQETAISDWDTRQMGSTTSTISRLDLGDGDYSLNDENANPGYSTFGTEAAGCQVQTYPITRAATVASGSTSSGTYFDYEIHMTAPMGALHDTRVYPVATIVCATPRLSELTSSLYGTSFTSTRNGTDSWCGDDEVGIVIQKIELDHPEDVEDYKSSGFACDDDYQDCKDQYVKDLVETLGASQLPNKETSNLISAYNLAQFDRTHIDESDEQYKDYDGVTSRARGYDIDGFSEDLRNMTALTDSDDMYGWFEPREYMRAGSDAGTTLGGYLDARYGVGGSSGVVNPDCLDRMNLMMVKDTSIDTLDGLFAFPSATDDTDERAGKDWLMADPIACLSLNTHINFNGSTSVFDGTEAGSSGFADNVVQELHSQFRVHLADSRFATHFSRIKVKAQLVVDVNEDRLANAITEDLTAGALGAGSRRKLRGAGSRTRRLLDVTSKTIHFEDDKKKEVARQLKQTEETLVVNPEGDVEIAPCYNSLTLNVPSNVLSAFRYPCGGGCGVGYAIGDVVGSDIECVLDGSVVLPLEESITVTQYNDYTTDNSVSTAGFVEDSVDKDDRMSRWLLIVIIVLVSLVLVCMLMVDIDLARGEIQVCGKIRKMPQWLCNVCRESNAAKKKRLRKNAKALGLEVSDAESGKAKSGRSKSGKSKSGKSKSGKSKSGNKDDHKHKKKSKIPNRANIPPPPVRAV
jgi:hypothetical protein